MTITKTRGRPKKLDKAPPTKVLQMRILPELYEELRADAVKGGRSISAQAERRLIYGEPDANDVARVIGMTMDLIVKREGKHWADDESVRLQCRATISYLANVMLGDLPEDGLEAEKRFQDLSDGVLAGDEVYKFVTGTTFDGIV